jgi:tol-pal system protein YbgF
MKPAPRSLFIFCIFMLLGGCASITDVKGLDDRLSRIESENRNLKIKTQELSEELDRQRESYANQNAEFDQLREDMRKISGKLDENQYQFNQQKQAWDRSIENLKDSVGHLSSQSLSAAYQTQHTEGAGPAVSGERPRSEGPAVDNSAVENMSEEELYRYAKEAFDRKEFENSRQYFEKFLEKYPNSRIADNGRFWIGEAYYAEGWYQKAILEYQEVIEKYPKGNKVPGAYLKQGISFSKIGENANAKLVLNELIKRFPGTNEAELAKQQIKQIQ